MEYQQKYRFKNLGSPLPMYVGAIVIAIVFCLMTLTDAAIAGCAGGPQCQGIRSCHAFIYVPSLGDTLEIDVSGPALATVIWKGTEVELTWVKSEFTGTHPFLGDIHISLSGLTTSTGVVIPFCGGGCDSLDCTGCFPATNTNELYFRYEFSNPMIPPLLSDGPLIIEAVIDSIPPVGATYHLVGGPLRLFAEGDTTQTTVVELVSANVMFFEATIPTLTEWGLIIFGVLLLGFITWVFLRRRKAAVSLR